MTRNAYVDLCLNVQATRRHFEGLRTPLAPAIGVAASLYTHQLANVLRVLTDIRVRHLLADEVGLGKTVQALMILNALRYQKKDLMALVIVPDRLVPQWRDEIMTRAHTAPFDDEDGEEDEEDEGQYIRLAWEAQLRPTDSQEDPQFVLSDIDPLKFNVLIVDELQSLRADVQDRIVRVAADFEHVLVLTATPAFQRVGRHAQLFALLEPERTANSRWRIALSERGSSEELSVGDELSKWPEWASRSIVDEFIARDRDAESTSDEAALPAAAMAHCAYRRVIRTRRVDYSGVLPMRRHCPIVVEPLGAEAERQSLMWQYLGYLDELSIQIQPVLLAKRVILSPPSLEQRVDFLRRKGHDRVGLLERIKPLLHQNQGDSRVDALVDLLAQVWSRDPSERVLVAAQDNLTVDYLYELVLARLPEIGPLYHRVPLVAARIRQGMMTEAVEDLGGFENETNENLEAFQRGDAQVLFAPEAAQVGLNLQCARVLVLYSVPWRPEEVEQWIGRLDRIGNAAAFSDDGECKTIDVYTIVQRGLVDEKVVTVLKHFHVFERSVNLDGDHLYEVAQMIESTALRPEDKSWRDLEVAMEEMAAADEVQELESALRPYIPWNLCWATKIREDLEALPPAQPVLRDLHGRSATGPRAWERALEEMVKLLKYAGDYHIRLNTDPESGNRFQTLWYRFGEREMYGGKEVCSKVILSFGADPGHERSPRHAHAFITRRDDIKTPPRRSVMMPLEREQVRRPRHYLNFGDALHDELIDGWLPHEGTNLKMGVMFFDDHAIWAHATPGLYLLRISVIDPCLALTERSVEERTLELIAHAATDSSPEGLINLIQKFTEKMHCALEADVRWLRAQLTAKMSLEVRRHQQDLWIPVESEEVSALLNPMAHERKGVPRADDLYIADKVIDAAAGELNRMREAEKTEVRSAWSHHFPEFKLAIQKRMLVVDEEGRDAIALAEMELRSAEKNLEVALERGNRAQITRANNTRESISDTFKMVEVLWDQRSCWLRECEQEVVLVHPREQLTALVQTLRTQ